MKKCHCVEYCLLLKDRKSFVLKYYRNGVNAREAEEKSKWKYEVYGCQGVWGAKFVDSFEAEVLQENWADDSILPHRTFQSVGNTVPGHDVRSLAEPLEFNLTSEARGESGYAKFVCDKLVTADVDVNIRRRTSLIFRGAKRRGVQKLMSRQTAQHVLIGSSIWRR